MAGRANMTPAGTRKAGGVAVIQLPCPLALLGFASLLRLSCGVPVFPVLVISDEPFLADEMVLLAAAQDVRSVIDSFEFCSDEHVPAASMDVEDGIEITHVRIDKNVIGECLVEREEYLLAIDIHAVENIDIVVDELGHDSDKCAASLIGEFGAAFDRLPIVILRSIPIRLEFGEPLLRICGILPGGVHISLECLRAFLACLFLMLIERDEVGELLLFLLDELVIAFAVSLELDFGHRICLSFGVCCLFLQFNIIYSIEKSIEFKLIRIFSIIRICDFRPAPLHVPLVVSSPIRPASRPVVLPAVRPVIPYPYRMLIASFLVRKCSCRPI